METWSRPGTSLAVLGHPIKHSISPPMHNAALAALTLTEPLYSNWQYFRFDVRPDDLPQALALLHEKRFHGINLTVPHKIIAMRHVAEIDPAAQPVGAVNTLRWNERGWIGFNTDGYGLAAAIREDLQTSLTGADVLLLGAGGAARGAAVECLQRGCRSLTITNRTAANLDALLLALRPIAGKIPLRGVATGAGSSLADIPTGLLVINATSAGLKPEDQMPLDLALVPRPNAVFDMIYNPVRTSLLQAAAARGISVANGLGMLVHQGARALEVWTGIAPNRTSPTMAAAAQAALATR